MDKRSDDIRQDIESTRAALDEKIDMLESKARETFDLRHQVSERPWVALGAAVAVGYVLGSLGESEDTQPQRWHGQPATTVDYNQHAYSGPSTTQKIKEKSADFLGQFDDEIDMLKTAAVTAITTMLRDTIRQAVPAMSEHIDRIASERGVNLSQGQGASQGANQGMTQHPTVGKTRSSAPNVAPSYDSATGGNTAGSNTNMDEMPEWNRYGTPPPTPTRDESEYFTTYKPDGEQQRIVGDERSRY